MKVCDGVQKPREQSFCFQRGYNIYGWPTIPFWQLEKAKLIAKPISQNTSVNFIQPSWRAEWQFLQKLQIELPRDPAIPLLSVCFQKSTIQRDTRTPVFIEAIFTIATTWKQPKCPSTEEWIKKVWYLRNRILLSNEKEGNNAICSNIDGLRYCRTE